MMSSISSKKFRRATEIVHIESDNNDPYNPSCTPIYQTATFKQSSATSFGDYDYTRSGNPTRSQLERHLAKLCGAQYAFAVSSGMTALDVLVRLVKTGEEIIAGNDIYGGTNRLLKFVENQGIKTHHVDTCDIAAVEAAMTPATRIVLLETPSNPLIKIVDLKGIAMMVHKVNPNTLVVVDNTMMSPYFQRSLELDCDIEYHSGTKYLSGHHDLMAGVIVCNSKTIADQLFFTINATGVGIAPFDAWLLMRGLKTMSVRMDRQQQNAQIIAEYLEKKGFVVHYPGLKSHPQYQLHFKQASGAGAVLSFETGSTLVSEQVVEAARLFTISVSFGCVNSLISMPCRMSHASIPAAVRKERALPEDLIRLCIGIEDVNDLLEDLEFALKAAECL